MQTYIALLRGINVGGHNKIIMADLKRLFQSLGYTNVTTYIQSGNVVFQSKEINTSTIEKSIIETIEKEFGYAIKVLVLRKNDLEITFNSNPFIQDANNYDFKKLCATFLEKTPTKEGILKVQKLAAPEEQLFFIEKTVYLYCPNGFGRTKLSNNNIETKLKIAATSRNWNTITKLVELSNH